MNLISTPGNPLRGSTTLPGDKSISHRAALFAALAVGESRIENFLVSGVTDVMLGALTSLGVKWTLKDTTLELHGQGLHGLRSPTGVVDCGNSATTMRLLTGALAAANIPAVLDGSMGLRRRPMRRIVNPLRTMGVRIEASEEGTAPLKLTARVADHPLRPLDYELPVASAQVKSALLLASLACDSPSSIHEPGPSRDHTERMLASMGVPVTTDPLPVDDDAQYATRGTFHVPPSTLRRVTLYPPGPLALNPLHINLPGDISSAAFLIVAALITPGSEIILHDVGLNPTRTGLLDALLSMGADIQISNQRDQHNEPVGDVHVRHSHLHGISVDGQLVVRMIDEFPIFAVAASFSKGRTIVSQAGELRNKESDRIAILCKVLKALDVEVQETADGFSIHGGKPPSGGTVNAHGDHRLAMSMVVTGLAAQQPVAVRGAGVIDESFPGFVDTLKSLGAQI